MKVGAFLAPGIADALFKDLVPVRRLTKKDINLPQVRTISQADIDAHNSGERPLGETEMEAPKKTVFTPVMETKKKK